MNTFLIYKNDNGTDVFLLDDGVEPEDFVLAHAKEVGDEWHQVDAFAFYLEEVAHDKFRYTADYIFPEEWSEALNGD